MQKLPLFAVFGIIVLQTVALQGKLSVIIPKTQSMPVSVCVGDKVSLEVEISQSEGPVSITWWTHGSSVMDDRDHYSLGEGGKKLTILDVLPPHSGVYDARVNDTKTENSVSFIVDVKDIFMRLLVKNPVTIPLGGTGTLRVSKSDEGALWWVHGGSLVQTTAEPSHYRFVDSTGSTGSVLEISDAQPEQAGIYEVILRSGGCEILNVIQVNVEQYDSLLAPIIAAAFALISTTVLVTIVWILHVRSKTIKGRSEENQISDNSKSDSYPAVKDPIYSTIEETIYDRRNIYDDPYTLGEVEPEDHSDIYSIYTAPEEVYDNLGIYTGLNDIYGHT